MTRCPVCFSRDVFAANPDIAEIAEGIALVEVMEFNMFCGDCNAEWCERFKKVGEYFKRFGKSIPSEKLPFQFGRSTDA